MDVLLIIFSVLYVATGIALLISSIQLVRQSGKLIKTVTEASSKIATVSGSDIVHTVQLKKGCRHQWRIEYLQGSENSTAPIKVFTCMNCGETR